MPKYDKMRDSIYRNPWLMISPDPSLELTLKRLRELRPLLLQLHKALLESEKLGYEEVNGRIQTTGEYFQLVVGHEWFNWLRPISQFIVQIDELLSSKEPVALHQADELWQQAQQLLQPVATGTISEQRYYLAIQRDPDIAFMHAEVSQILTADR